MLKKNRVKISQIKTLGLTPIRIEEISFQKHCSYQQFCQQIKQKFNQFQKRSYLVFLPNLGGIHLSQHNFDQFLQNLEKQSTLYSQILIQKIVPVSVIDELSAKEQFSSNDELVAPIFAQIHSDKDRDISKIIFECVFPNIACTDAQIKIFDSDCIVLQDFGVISKDKQNLLQLSQLKAKINAELINKLQSF